MIKIEITLQNGETLATALEAFGIQQIHVQRPGPVSGNLLRKMTELAEGEIRPIREDRTRATESGSPTDEPMARGSDWHGGAPRTDTAPLGPMDGDRKRGDPGPGHRRRTNKQIADDQAYFAQSAAESNGTRAYTPETNGEDKPQVEIASEDERPVDPEVAAQDAADEAAETEARKAEKPTIEDLRVAVGRYAEKFGAKAGIDNIRAIIGKPLIEVGEDEMAAAIARVEAAMNAVTDPLAAIQKHEAAAASDAGDDPLAAPIVATKADLVEALMVYGRRYDGTDDSNKMLITRQDIPPMLEKLFGLGKTSVVTIPQTPEAFGRARAAVLAATRDNPFKREVKGA